MGQVLPDQHFIAVTAGKTLNDEHWPDGGRSFAQALHR
jgi:hypothetical protein